MAKEKIILIGAGGHCRSCMDVIESEGSYKIAGLVDRGKIHDKNVYGYKVIADDKGISDLTKKYTNYLVAIAGARDSSRREEIFEDLLKLKVKFPIVISPLAYVAGSACLKEGTIVMHKTVVNAGATVGRNCIVNTMALIEHDVTVGDHCHISTGSVINGYCRVGKRVFIGSNSVLRDDIRIADDVIIGAGSVVTKSIDEAGVYAGNPVCKIKNVELKVQEI